MKRLGLMFLLVGCGGGGGSDMSWEDLEREGEERSLSLTPYEGVDLEPWRVSCVEDNVEALEEDYARCMGVPIYPEPYNEAYCESRYNSLLLDLEGVWEDLLRYAAANLRQCGTDWRVEEEECYAFYEQDLSRAMFECDRIVP